MAGIRAEVTFGVDKRSLDRAAASVDRVMGRLGGKDVNFKVNDKSFTQPLGRMTGGANEFSKSLEASNARVIAFGASVGIINGISDAFKSLVRETIAFEKTMADVNVVLNASSGALERFGSGLFDVAKNTAQSFNVAAEAALEFSRQGLSMEEILKRTNDALVLTRLTSLDATESVKGLTAAVNAFSASGLTTTQIIDKMAAVDVKFAVSAEDLIKALERTGSVAIDAGVPLDKLIGLVTSLQQTTARGGAVIGNGLKTIFTRIQRPEALAQLEAMNIQVKNLAGVVLPASTVLENMAVSFDKLTQSQQSNVVQFSAGIFQANVFRAALRDLAKDQSIYAQATLVSADASGQAALKNEMLNKTLSAMASQTGTAIKELAGVMGELMFKPEIGDFLGAFQGMVEFVKNALGGGEDQGSTFAKGLVRGIGNVLTGPTAIAFGAIFIKLFVNIARFAHSSLKDVLGILTHKDKVRNMEESIVTALGRNKDIQVELNRLTGDRKAQSAFMLKLIERQTNALREQKLLAATLARPLVTAGVNSDFSVPGKGPVDLDGDGVAGAHGVLPAQRKREKREARRGGYQPGTVDSMNIKGVGSVVYNSAEEVKRFPGMQQAAIIPPEGSSAGMAYRDAFVGKHGFDPYAAEGFVPNFAALSGSTLNLDQSRVDLWARPTDIKADAKTSKLLEGIGIGKTGRQVLRATPQQMLANRGEGGSHTKNLVGIVKFLESQGITEVTRPFNITNFPWRGDKGAKGTETETIKRVNKGRGRGPKQMTTGGRGGDDTFPVDTFGKGLTPIEVKSGQWDQANLIMKSLRLYSDDSLLSFMGTQWPESAQLIAGQRDEKLLKSGRLLQKKGILQKGIDPTQAVLAHQLAGGFVPNFVGRVSPGGNQAVGQGGLTTGRRAGFEANSLNTYNMFKKAYAAFQAGQITGTNQSIGRFHAPPRKGDFVRDLLSNKFVGKATTPKLAQALKFLPEHGGGMGPMYKNMMTWVNAFRQVKGAGVAQAKGGRKFEEQLRGVFGGRAPGGGNSPMDFPTGFAQVAGSYIGKGPKKLTGGRGWQSRPLDSHISGGHTGSGFAYKVFRYLAGWQAEKPRYSGKNKAGLLKSLTTGTGEINLNALLGAVGIGMPIEIAKHGADGLVKGGSFQLGERIKAGSQISPEIKQAILNRKGNGARRATTQYLQEGFSFGRGFVPNFSNPLKDAISRETGSGISKSQIRVESSPSLRNRGNPMGLAVTNTRDEPAGVGQGMRRARSRGIDPRVHGGGRGFVSNFAIDPSTIRGPVQSTTYPGHGITGGDRASQKAAQAAAQENTDAQNRNTQGMEDGIMKLFFFQSIISLSNGFLEEFATSTNTATRGFAKFGLALSATTAAYIQQKNIISEVSRAFKIKKEDQVGLGNLFKGGSKGDEEGDTWAGKAKGGLKSALGGIGKFGKGLLRFAPAVGQLYTGFTALNKAAAMFGDGFTLMELMGSGTRRAAIQIERLGKVSEKASSAIDNMTKQEEGKKKITELLIKGDKRTYTETKTLGKLQLEQIKLDTATLLSTQAIIELQSSGINVEREAGKMFVELTAKGVSAAEALKKVQESTVLATQMETISKTFQGMVNAAESMSWLSEQEFGHIEDSETQDAIRNVLKGGMGNLMQNLDKDVREKLVSEVGTGDFSESMGIDYDKVGRTLLGIEGLPPLLAIAIQDFVDRTDDEEDAFKELQRAIRNGAKEADKIEEKLVDQRHNFEAGTALLALINNELKLSVQIEKDTIKIQKMNLNLQKQRFDKEQQIFNAVGTLSKEASIEANLEEDIRQLRQKKKLDDIDIERKSKEVGQASIKSIVKESMSAKNVQDAIMEEPNLLAFYESFLKKGMGGASKEVKEAVDALLITMSEGGVTQKDLNDPTAKFTTTGGNKLDAKMKSVAIDTKHIEAGFASLGDLKLSALQGLADIFDESGLIRVSDKIKQIMIQREDAEAQALKTRRTQLAKEIKGAEQTAIGQHITARDSIGLKAMKAALSADHAGVLKETSDAVRKNLMKEIEFSEYMVLKNSTVAKTIELMIEQGKYTLAGETLIRERLKTENQSAAAAYGELQARLLFSHLHEEMILEEGLKLATEKGNLKLALKELKTRTKYEMVYANAIDEAQTRFNTEGTQADGQLAATMADYIVLRNQRGKSLEVTKKNLKTELIQQAIELEKLDVNREVLKSDRRLLELKASGTLVQEQINKFNENELLLLQLQQGPAAFAAQAGLDLNARRMGDTRDLFMAGNTAQMTGRPEDLLTYQQKLNAVNKEAGEGQQAMGALREKIIEMNIAAENFSADLVKTGFDSAKTGLTQLFKDISSGAKRSSEAWEDFYLGVAKSLADKIIERNVDKIMGDLTYAFTGESTKTVEESINAKLGVVATSVLPKLTSQLELNRLAVKENTAAYIRSIRKGVFSADALKRDGAFTYGRTGDSVVDFATDKNVSVFGAPVQVDPSNWKAKGGYVTGPGGVDRVPAMLTAGEYVIPKDVVQKFDAGGRLRAGVKGTVSLYLMSELARQIGDHGKKPGDEPPTFNESKLSNINLGSSVNIGRGDARMSSRFLANDPAMQEYKDFLIELSNYKSGKINEKFAKKMQTLGSVLGVMSSFAMGQMTGYLSQGAQAGWKKLKGFFGKGKTGADYDEVLTPGGTGLIGSDPDWMHNAVEAARVDALFFGAEGGVIPSMLTAGEAVIPASIAGSMGYDNLDYMNNTGNIPTVQGPGGIDNVGPVGLSPGDFVMNRNSTEKLRSTGGETQVAGRTGDQMSETTNNININVAIDQSGAEVASGDADGEASYNKEKELSSKIKNAVIEVIRQEKRIGGELS